MRVAKGKTVTPHDLEQVESFKREMQATAADRLAERCSVCSYSIAAHREQDPEKRFKFICERGLAGRPI